MADLEQNGGLAGHLSSFFHSFPHFDLSFNPVSSEFDPESPKYQEAVLLWGAVPVLWMLLWILIIMIFFCFFCIRSRLKKDRGDKRQKGLRCQRWLSFIFSIVVILLLACAVLASEYASQGLTNTDKGIDTMKSDFHEVKKQVVVLLHNIDTLKNSTAVFLKQAFTTSKHLDENSRPLLLESADRFMESLTALGKLVRARMILPMMNVGANYDGFSDIQMYEPYRRISTASVCALLILIVSICLCCLGCKKYRCILVSSVLMVFNLFIIWILVGAYTIAAVGISDFCADPQSYLNSTLSAKGQTFLMTFYNDCSAGQNLLSMEASKAQDTLSLASNSLHEMNLKAAPMGGFIIENITNAQSNLSVIMEQFIQLGASTDCSKHQRTFQEAEHGICQNTLIGCSSALGALIIAGLLLIILVFLYHSVSRLLNLRPPIAHSNNIPVTMPLVQPSAAVSRQRRPRSSRNGRRSYMEVETNDFNARDYPDRSDNPLYYRFSQISTGDRDSYSSDRPGTAAASMSAQPSAPGRHSPPPAYQKHTSSDQFYSTYGNINGPDNENNTRNDLNRSNTFRSN